MIEHGRDYMQARKPEGWRGKPEYAGDGMLAACWRKVRSGGIVLFGTDKWQHEDLLPFVGKWVWVQVETYWMTAISCHRVRFKMIEDCGIVNKLGQSDFTQNRICEIGKGR